MISSYGIDEKNSDELCENWAYVANIHPQLAELSIRAVQNLGNIKRIFVSKTRYYTLKWWR